MRRGRIVLALVAILVVGLIAWLALRAPERRSEVPHAGAPATNVRSATTTATPTRRALPPRAAPEPALAGPARVVKDAALSAGAISGRVVSVTSGAGVPGAELTFAREGIASSAFADPAGRFSFAPDRPGLYQVAAVIAEGYLPFAPAWGTSPVSFVARAGVRIEGVTIVLAPAVEYLGVVVDARGAPVEGASVRILRSPGSGEEQALIPIPEHHESDARGEIRFRAPDGAILEASHPAHATARAKLDFAAQVQKRLVIRLGPRDADGTDGRARAGSIEGRVVSASGEPIAEAVVSGLPLSTEPASPEAALLASASALTGEDGRFVLADLEARAYRVSATKDGLAPAVVDTVAPGRRDLVLVLGAGGVLQGRVRSAATREPLPAFTVIVSVVSGPLVRSELTHSSVFDPDGAYRIEGLAPGDVEVSVAARGFAPAKPRAVTIPEPPAGPVTADFELSSGGCITGRVIEEGTRRPIEDARVTVEGSVSGSSAAPVPVSSVTAQDGAFELCGVAPGPRSITAAAEGHHGRIASGLDVAEGGRLGPITIELAIARAGEQPGLELAGIGVVLAARDDALVIGEVIGGGGAAEVGLARGDAILAVDGTPVVEMGYEGTIQRIRGPEGTAVRLLVQKQNGARAEISVPRRRVRK